MEDITAGGLTNRQAIDEVRAAVERLGEHFEAVQVLVSWNNASESFNIYNGCGNWFARQGMAHDFINKDVAQEQAMQIGDQLAMYEEDGE